MARYDDYGRELPDPTPVSVPAGFARPIALHEQIKRFIRTEMSRQAVTEEKESFEEADDFDVDEEGDPLSPYEIPEGLPERPQGRLDLDADPPPHPGAPAPPEPATQAAAASAPSTDSGTTPAGRK
jgi:hypothetical protein